MKQLFYLFFLVISIGFSSCDLSSNCPEAVDFTLTYPVEYEYSNTLRPSFEWTGEADESFILETSRTIDFKDTYELVEVTGNSYQSEKVYLEEGLIYWRVWRKGCEDVFQYNVFHTKSFKNYLSGTYTADNGDTLFVFEYGRADFSSECSFWLDTVTDWNDDEIKFEYFQEGTYDHGNLYEKEEGNATYHVETRTLEITFDCERRYSGNTHFNSFTFSGKK